MNKGPVRTMTPDEEVDEVQHQQRPGQSRMGRSTVVIRCPFCKADCEAYTWSLAGGGKRCSCGALHSFYGTTRRWKATA